MRFSYEKSGTVRLFWNIFDRQLLGAQVNVDEPPERDPEENAYLAAMSSFRCPKDHVGVFTFDLSDPRHIEVVERLGNLLDEGWKYFGFVEVSDAGEYTNLFISDPKPDELAVFNMDTKRWELPDNYDEIVLGRTRESKIAEIRAAALAAGRAGANIMAAPGVSYHMALTPEDVALLQQANTVAKIEWEMAGIEPGDPARTSEIKEKWLDEDGVEHTQLHPAVPEAVHNTILAMAALQAAEIYRRQETLIQAALDAKTVEAVEAISWTL